MISHFTQFNFKSISLFFGLTILICGNAESQESFDETLDSDVSEEVQFEIESLIRSVYIWHKDEGYPSFITLLTDSLNERHVGLSLDDLEYNLDDLRESNLFTTGFIDNYGNIYRTMDEKLKSQEIEWLVGRLPNFGTGVEPWCLCQDVPYDEPNPWSELEIEVINLNESSGEFYWKWGNLEETAGSGWNAHRYLFNVEKVDGKWKISFLEGLNVEDFTRKNE